MPLRVTFELSDRDLKHFRKIMREARVHAKIEPEEELIQEAQALLTKVQESDVPDFVRERLLQVGTFVDMLEDEEWALAGENRERIKSALAYFNEPIDLIPDHIPGFGFLDDAVMVELVCRELHHDIEAYHDFCAYRKELDKKRGTPDEARLHEIETRRKALHQRMTRRRQRRRLGTRGRTPKPRSPFSLW